MPLDEAKAVLVAVGTATSRHNMVRRAACQGLADSGHTFAAICKNRLPKGSVPTPAADLDLLQGGVSEEPAEEEAGDAAGLMDSADKLLKLMAPYMAKFMPNIPISSLNMSHFGDTQWHGSLGKKDAKVKAYMDAVMGYDVAGGLPKAGIDCSLKAQNAP